jgi:hypothetical protein
MLLLAIAINNLISFLEYKLPKIIGLKDIKEALIYPLGGGLHSGCSARNYQIFFWINSVLYFLVSGVSFFSGFSLIMGDSFITSTIALPNSPIA